MNRKGMLKYWALWVIILVLQLLWLSSILDQPHGEGDLLLHTMMILVTLTTGGVGLWILARSSE
ncbi:MAG: hypothetical protein H0Z33_00950 [Bacillaceae bacterium]|nr:hypothetical protein [Bacillaceae bacterium]